MDVQTFDARVYAEVANKNSKSLDVLKQARVRQLKELSSVRTLAMEATTSFTASVGAPYLGEYADSTITDFPADVMEIDRVWYLTGSTRHDIPGPFGMDEIRYFNERNNAHVTGPEPRRWAWFGGKLWWAPTLSAAKVLYIDYFKDATKDTATGAAITEASTTHTNPWFDRGELVLRYAVLAEYYANPLFLDERMAQACLAQRGAYLATMEREVSLRKGVHVRAPGVLGGYVFE